MRSKTLALIAFVVAAVGGAGVLASTAFSQSLPSGSWRSTCGSARMSGWTLYANCNDGRGGIRSTSIDVRSCGGRGVVNQNGNLRCAGGPGPGGGGGGGGALPDGSYRRSCTNERMSGWTLSANCRDSRGAFHWSSLDTRDCRGRDIANIEGRLSCRRGGGGGGGGGGGYRSSLTLYTQPYYGGRQAVLDRPAPSLGPWEMADKSRSLRIRGGGRWQVCTGRDFTGRCVVVSRDEPNLGRLGLNQQISSARPWR